MPPSTASSPGPGTVPVFQSGTILVILLYVNYYDRIQAHAEPYARWFRDFCIWGTVAITVVSGLLYLQRAAAFFREQNPA